MPPASEYTDTIGQAICEHICEGMSIREIAALPEMPASSTICKWLSVYPSFAEQYARAREIQAELFANEIVEIADDTSNDYMMRKQGDEEIEVVNQEAINRSRLRVDARKWVASKLLPKKYGDKVSQEISGPNGQPIQTTVTVEFVKPGE